MVNREGIPPSSFTNFGFSIPSDHLINNNSKKENEELLDKKKRILTELAAIENGFNLFDFLNPARDQLQSSSCDVPCSIELLHFPKVKKKEINRVQSSKQLSELILKIANNPNKEPYTPRLFKPKCHEIIKHSNLFYANLNAIHEARTGFLTSFCLLPNKTQPEKINVLPQVEKVEEDTLNNKRIHPFFPDVKGIQPLLGLMKQQLGEFPSFIKNPPSDDECLESVWTLKDDVIHNHLLEICGSSSDDDFDPDDIFNPNKKNFPNYIKN